MLPRMKSLLACGLALLSSCVAVSHARMDTTWRGEAHPGVMSTLSFKLDGSARWTFDLPSGAETYDVQYELDMADPFPHLDFSGFASGPLAGKTLYGIADWDDDTLRYDARPGDPAQGGDGVRPTAFTAETRRFERVR